MTFNELNISEELLKALVDLNYTKPTQVQKLSIPIIQDRKDLLAGAETGTGKTAAFSLPLLDRIHASNVRSEKHAIRAVILTPTRELCKQIDENVKAYAKYLPINSMTLYGGVSMVPQLEKLAKGVDVIVATPGRLFEFLEKKHLTLAKVEVLVLDEADRMLDMGFVKDINKIVAFTPKKRQTLLFSATFKKSVKNLAKTILKTPIMLETTRSNATAEMVDQIIHPVVCDRKAELISFLIGSKNYQQVLVFTKTKDSAKELEKHLMLDGLKCDSIHGDKTQAARLKALNAFKEGKIRVLVATDVVSRGIDINQLPQVINYELPTLAEDYIHRIGRTGRAGHKGLAISLICSEEAKQLNNIEHLIKSKIRVQAIEGYEPPKKREKHNSEKELGGRNKKSQESESKTPRAKRSNTKKRRVTKRMR
ncbi:MAG: DEAD/DEAH box helicase [Helicobacteraceae bacterium]|nr:DEAD/DEAH box helicase [Helicobacteraceae bacterium]